MQFTRHSYFDAKSLSNKGNYDGFSMIVFQMWQKSANVKEILAAKKGNSRAG
jgi:hypothetical protein